MDTGVYEGLQGDGRHVSAIAVLEPLHEAENLRVDARGLEVDGADMIAIV
jgi:hypothetical protein